MSRCTCDRYPDSPCRRTGHIGFLCFECHRGKCVVVEFVSPDDGGKTAEHISADELILAESQGPAVTDVVKTL